MMQFTGERYVSQLDIPEISYEHWHRYLWACQFARDKVVLDVACGEGYGSDILADVAKVVTGVDISPEAIQFASSKYLQKNLAFHVGKAEEIPVDGENIYDLIVSFETIEHLNEEKQHLFLSELHRLLAPDGMLLISTPNKLFYTDQPNYNNEHHFKEFYPNEFVETLQKRFGNVALYGQKVYPISYIWSLNQDVDNYYEHQIEHAHGRFSPTPTDRKEALYVIAVCSNKGNSHLGNSLLIDVSSQSIAQRVEQVSKRDDEIARLNTIVVERNSFVKNLEDQLQAERGHGQHLTNQLGDIKSFVENIQDELNQKNQQLYSAQQYAQDINTLQEKGEQSLLATEQRLSAAYEHVFILTNWLNERDASINQLRSQIDKMNQERNYMFHSSAFQIAITVRLLANRLRGMIYNVLNRKS